MSWGADTDSRPVPSGSALVGPGRTIPVCRICTTAAWVRSRRTPQLRGSQRRHQSARCPSPMNRSPNNLFAVFPPPAPVPGPRRPLPFHQLRRTELSRLDPPLRGTQVSGPLVEHTAPAEVHRAATIALTAAPEISRRHRLHQVATHAPSLTAASRYVISSANIVSKTTSCVHASDGS